MRELLEDLTKMRAIHRTGGACCEKCEEWKNSIYGWHNSRFPPEYRLNCLRGGEFRADPSCDLYYKMACYYERATGQKAPYNFELDRVWRDCLTDCFAKQGLRIENAAAKMIAGCTRWKSQRRMRDAGELLETDYMKILTSFFGL